MPIRVIDMRWRITPAVSGCRWCGYTSDVHTLSYAPSKGWSYAPSKGWHQYAEPTREQMKARWYASRSTHAQVRDA